MPRHYAWEDYFWPNTTVLANKLGIVDEAELRDVEYDQVVDRQGEIERGEMQIARTFDGPHLRAVHAHLFQDVYEWAGQYRTVDMAKGGRAFLPYRHLDEWLDQSAEQISATPWGSLDHDQFADAVANVFANVNYAHGFREGNGRSTRIFLQQCTSDGQFELDFTVIAQASERWNEASRLSVPRHYGGLPEPDPLREIFREIAVPRPDTPDAVPSPTADDMGVDPVEYKSRVAREADNESLRHGDRDRTSAARTLVPPSRSAMRTARTDGPAGAQPHPAPKVPRTGPREHGGGYHL